MNALPDFGPIPQARPQSTGGLGGLGGFVNSQGFGNILQAAGMSMMGAPRSNPLRDFGRYYGHIQDQQLRQDEFDRERADELASREAMEAALIAAGVSPEEARTLAINTQAAQLRLSQLQREREQAEYEGFLSRMPGYGGAAADSSGGSSGGLGGLGGSATIDGNNIPEIVPTPARQQIAQDYGGASVFAEPGAAQMNANRFTPGGAIADPNFIEPTPAPGPGAEIPLAKPAGNKTVAWLQENDPEVATLVDQGVISPQDGLGIATQRMQGQRAFEQRAQASQAELDGLYQKRDAMARWLTEAPSEKAYNKGKRHLDIYDAQIARLEKQREATAGTETMRNLQWRAEQAGLQPGTREYQNFMATGGKEGSLVTINNTPEGDMFAGLPKDVREEIFKRQVEAQDAADLIGVTNQGLQLLDQGAITGAGSDAKIAAIKWAQTLGVPVEGDIIDAANNTETYRSVMAKAVGKVIKNFGSGTGLSDADRQYAERLAGGDTNLNEPAIRRILAAGANQAQDKIRGFSTMRDKVLGGDLGALLSVQEAPAYTPSTVQGAAPRARNPQTGQTLEWDGNQWRPVQ